jgi:hypothetical protein
VTMLRACDTQVLTAIAGDALDAQEEPGLFPNQTNSERHCHRRRMRKERLDPLKAEPENKDKQDDLYNFCVELLVTIEEEKRRAEEDAVEFANLYTRIGNRPYSTFKEEDKDLLVVCFAWLGMPEMCERVRKPMGLPLDKTVCHDLRAPIERTGGIARYQSFLTEALFYEDFTELYYALDALVGSRGKIGCDPAVLPWTREMFLRTMDSYPPPPQSTMEEDEAIILMRLCEWCGPDIYAERYVVSRHTATGQSVLLTFIACSLS